MFFEKKYLTTRGVHDGNSGGVCVHIFDCFTITINCTFVCIYDYTQYLWIKIVSKTVQNYWKCHFHSFKKGIFRILQPINGEYTIENSKWMTWGNDTSYHVICAFTEQNYCHFDDIFVPIWTTCGATNDNNLSKWQHLRLNVWENTDFMLLLSWRRV